MLVVLVGRVVHAWIGVVKWEFLPWKEKMRKSSDNNGGLMAYIMHFKRKQEHQELSNHNPQEQKQQLHQKGKNNTPTTKYKPSASTMFRWFPKPKGLFSPPGEKNLGNPPFGSVKGTREARFWVWFRCGFWNVCDAWDHIEFLDEIWTKFLV